MALSLISVSFLEAPNIPRYEPTAIKKNGNLLIKIPSLLSMHKILIHKLKDWEYERE